ncbi:phage major tail tube protein [bacterium (Candidatus Blackallbacteria) CG13_big_fil_rev_8_21_14_2_50_49_14]|nr:MAG: phage major tail tube protein [bacterium (Candidatus Blackallbacteria) CG18_big_fil_WC_8_21_14_2_50_49_26]PIW46647.1 MAG: phage major tail tube protein [bacterium (Candidatus Blackallbacteria) CG13_big_fil_rev_8_21_14_2_50_49_14]
MSKIAINRLTNANVFFEGNSLLGRVEEITLPEIKVKTAEHKALGMVGSIEAFAGFEKLEGKIKWSSLYPDAMKKTANPFKSVQIQVRGSLESWTGQGRSEQKKVVINLTVAFKKFPGGNFKPQDNVELETDFACYYMKQTVNGEDIVEIDVLENIYKAGGVDMLATYRSNIGG